MPQSPKKGLDYAGWETNIFDGDHKIDTLIAECGCKGFVTYFYLCQTAYKFNGYFCEWGFDASAAAARRIGGGVTSGSVTEAVKTCLRIGLFDKALFDKWGILTSRGIQRRYCNAVSKRENKAVIAEYWLLSDKETVKGLVKVALNAENDQKTAESSPEEYTVHNSTEHNITEQGKHNAPSGAAQAAPSLPSFSEVECYFSELGKAPEAEKFYDHYSSNGWLVGGKTPMRNWKAAARGWIRRMGTFGKPEKPQQEAIAAAKTDIDMDEYQRLSEEALRRLTEADE